ncbi:la-related protein 6A-like isoform X2 [Phragmites australis]|uniref:la-related protein 6A-like isoform X2 n=1 Tax=Phragmites australis TaxID=29695 RepID=UPI002D7810B5|nr:la-related protein 6A-like isoform X2 [Phragmites australis]
MDDQAPPLEAVAPAKRTVVADELQPPLYPLEVEDALPSGMDGQAPPPAAIAHELPPTLSPTSEVEDALPVVPDTVDATSAGTPEAGAGSVVLTDELHDQIVKQVEYYFSHENLPTDQYLLKFVKKNKDAFVPIGAVAKFRRMKKLIQDLSIIEAALRTSSKLDEHQHQLLNAKGGPKGRYRGQGKGQGQIQQNTYGQGEPLVPE